MGINFCTINDERRNPKDLKMKMPTQMARRGIEGEDNVIIF